MDALPLGLVGDGALRAAVAADREVTRMEAVRLDHLAQYLGEVSEEWEAPTPGPGVEQAVRLGGPGTPAVPEFAVCEVATALGMTQPAATGLCADVLDLAYRLRSVAGSVRCGELSFARARLIARHTRDLPLEQAALVEERLCTMRNTSNGPVPMAAQVAMSRLKTITDQAVLTVRGPESAAEAEARVAESLWVRVSPAEPGAADVIGRLAAADAVRLDQRLDQIAGWLQQVGDDRPKPILRAVALGLLADPDLLRALDDLRQQRGPDGRTPDSDRAGDPGDRRISTGAAEPEPLEGLARVPEPAAREPDLAPPPGDRVAGVDPPERGPTADTGLPPPRDGITHGDPPSLAPTTDLDPPPREHARDADPMAWLEPPPGEPGDPVDLGDRGEPTSRVQPAGIAGCPAGLLEKFASISSTVLYLHLDRGSDTWTEERGGALTSHQAKALVGHSKVSVRPVLDLAEPLSYTGYVAPPRLKEQLALLNAGYCPFPYCHRRARAGDVDHQIPAASFGPTATRNTHRPCRKHHRAKDKGGWRVVCPVVGLWVWTSPAGAVYFVTNGTTTQLNGITRYAGETGQTTQTNQAQAQAQAQQQGHSGQDATPSTPHQARSDVPTTVKEAWTPPWDPWHDPEPLTQDEHDHTYGLLNLG